MPDMLSDDQITQIRERLKAFDDARFYSGGFGVQWEGFAPVAADLYRNAQEDLRTLLALVDQLRSERDAANKLKKLALAELAGYTDGFQGLVHLERFDTSAENMAYVLWFGKGRAERTMLIDHRETVEKRWKESQEACARLRAEVEQLHQEREEIRAALGLMAGGVGLSLAKEIKHQGARLRTALEEIVKRGARQPDLKLIEIAEAALASTRPDASPGWEP